MSGGDPHPQMAVILEEQRQAGLPGLDTMPLAEARAQFVRNNEAWNRDLPEVVGEDAVVGGVACRVLGPACGRVVVFVHGGGWTFGSPATHERFARLLAVGTGAQVVVPDYRLAPEHPAPAGIEDVLAVIAGLGDAARLVLCGDSAGANIALAAALAGPARPVAMLSLLYGCFAPVFETASHVRNGDGRYGLSTARMRWYWANWLGAAADARAVPMEADLTGLPRCHLVGAGLDPLCDDSLMLADRLGRHGVVSRLDIVPGVVHGFLQMTGRLEPALDATKMISDEIVRAFDQ